MNVRFLNGYIEIDYEPVAKILDGKDRKFIEHQLMEWAEFGTEELLSEAYEDGQEQGYANAEADRDEKLDKALDKALEQGVITDQQHSELCELL